MVLDGAGYRYGHCHGRCHDRDSPRSPPAPFASSQNRFARKATMMFGRKKKLSMRNSEISAPQGIEIVDMDDVTTDNAALATVAKLFDVYQPGVVFSEPATVGDHTVITASEVYVGMGVGFGRGAGGAGEGAGG